MKKLFTFVVVLLISFAASAQKIDWHEAKRDARLAAIEARHTTNAQLLNNKYYPAARKAQEITDAKYGLNQAEFDTLNSRFRVAEITGDHATVFAGRFHYKIPINARINPFNTKLQEGKEYFMCLVYNKAIREEKTAGGGSGIVPAGLIWAGLTPEQASRDAHFLGEFTKLQSTANPGYDRSPRYN